MLLQVPLLEMMGARSLARVLCAAPGGTKDPARFVRDAKAVATHQGAASALLHLLQIAVGRYTTLRSGQKLPATPFPLLAYLEDNPSSFTRDMANMDGVLETLYYTCAAILNLSTLRVAQLVLARRGLATLLGAQSLFSMPAPGASAQERRVGELLVGVVQNLAQHPQNRTAFYKAELRGTVALQRELLERGGILRSSSPSRKHGGGAGGKPQPVSTVVERGGVAGGAPRSVSPLREQPLPPLPPPRAKDDTWRPSVRVKSGPVELGRSLETALAAQLRPKAMFPAVAARPAGEAAAAAVHHVNETKGAAEAERGDSAAEEDATTVRIEEPSVVALFTGWMDSTFQGGGEAETVAAAPVKHFRMVHPETGEWRNEREGYPLLLRALRRPIGAMWADSPAARRVGGAKRWSPSISEYRQAAEDGRGPPMPAMAARLMRTNAPSVAEAPLDDAARQLAAGGVVEERLALLRLRPSTAERSGGRVPLTVLKPGVAPDGSVAPLPEPHLPVRLLS
jgi:hypothetical protein